MTAAGVVVPFGPVGPSPSLRLLTSGQPINTAFGQRTVADLAFLVARGVRPVASVCPSGPAAHGATVTYSVPYWRSPGAQVLCVKVQALRGAGHLGSSTSTISTVALTSSPSLPLVTGGISGLDASDHGSSRRAIGTAYFDVTGLPVGIHQLLTFTATDSPSNTGSRGFGMLSLFEMPLFDASPNVAPTTEPGVDGFWIQPERILDDGSAATPAGFQRVLDQLQAAIYRRPKTYISIHSPSDFINSGTLDANAIAISGTTFAPLTVANQSLATGITPAWIIRPSARYGTSKPNMARLWIRYMTASTNTITVRCIVTPVGGSSTNFDVVCPASAGSFNEAISQQIQLPNTGTSQRCKIQIQGLSSSMSNGGFISHVYLREDEGQPLVAADFTVLAPGAVTTLPSGFQVLRSSSNDTVQTGAATVLTGVAANRARVGSDGTHGGLVIDEARTSFIPGSRAPATAVGPPGWQTGISGTVTNNAAAGPDGATLAAEFNIPASGFGNYANSNGGPATYSGVVWQRAKTGTLTGNITWGDTGAARIPNSTPALTTTWQKIAATWTTLAAGSLVIPVDDRDSVARDVYTDLVNIELGQFPTEAKVGAYASAGDHLFNTQGPLTVQNGQLRLYVQVQPKGSSAAFQAAGNDMYLYSDPGSDLSIWISGSSLHVLCKWSGTTVDLGVAASWSAGDLVEFWVTMGAGIATQAQIQVNSTGSASLGVGASLTTITPPTGNVDVMNKAGANQLTAWVRKVEFWPVWGGPSWIAQS